MLLFNDINQLIYILEDFRKVIRQDTSNIVSDLCDETYHCYTKDVLALAKETKIFDEQIVRLIKKWQNFFDAN